VGPVTFPAYKATTANMRSLEDHRAERAEAVEQAAVAEQLAAAEKQTEDEKRRALIESLKK